MILAGDNVYFKVHITYKKICLFTRCCFCTEKLAFNFFQMKQFPQALPLPCMSQDHLCLFTMVSTSRQQPIMHLWHDLKQQHTLHQMDVTPIKSMRKHGRGTQRGREAIYSHFSWREQMVLTAEGLFSDNYNLGWQASLLNRRSPFIQTPEPLLNTFLILICLRNEWR